MNTRTSSQSPRSSHKPLSIFMINCDWRDMFGTSPAEFEDKLKRDELNPHINTFFILSWSTLSRKIVRGSLTAVHKKTWLGVLRPLLDVKNFFTCIYLVLKEKIRPDIWLCYDLGFVPALWVCSKIWGGTLVVLLSNQPRIYSKTRSFGSIKSAYSRMLEIVMPRFVDKFYTINDTMKEYVKQLGVAEKDIYIFTVNTIARERERARSAKRGVVRERYGIPASSKVLLTVARLEAEKNYPRLLELFAGLSSDHVLICLGRGSMLNQLKAQCEKLGIADRVHFPGFIHREEIWNYYADADAFVLLSRAEALGIVFWEAMYAGVPCIGSDVEGIVETMGRDGERGRVWTEKGGEQAFQTMVHEACSSEPALQEKKAAMVARAKAFVDQKIEHPVTINDTIKDVVEDIDPQS